jgi:hypothetical protein
VLPNAGKTALELRCAPLVGPNTTGSPCTNDSQCRSGLCVGGHCAAPCLGHGDCTEAGSCKAENVNVQGLGGSFAICVVSPCENSKACDPGETCSDIRDEGSGLKAFCRQGNPNGTPLGSGCQNGSTCQSVLCPAWLLSCTEACSGDPDCVAAKPEVCVDMFQSGPSIVAACAPKCDRVQDCPAPSTCVVTTYTKGNLHRFICAPPYGNDPLGAPCGSSNHCASGLCLSNYLNGQLVDQICTQPCLTGADCPTPGFGICTTVSMKTPDNLGEQLVKVCNHP